MAVLITGGHGHIGSWSAYYLAKAGEDVVIYDVNPQAPDYLSGVADRITTIRGDILDLPRLVETCQTHSIDGIIHTIGIMGEIVQSNPHRHVTLNTVGTYNVLEIARLFEVPKVVYTSTGAVYGAVDGIAVETQPPNPSDLYSTTKAACEYIGQQYGATFGFDYRIARVYFCYGPGKLPSTFIRLYQLAFGALEGMHGLSMDKGADQVLDFTYVEDAGRGIVQLYQAAELKHSIYNIATGVPSSLHEVATLAQKYSRFDVTVDVGPGTLMQRAKALDITRAREELGFEPKVDLETGIQRYAEWLERNQP